jgi:hypothetical protein
MLSGVFLIIAKGPNPQDFAICNIDGAGSSPTEAKEAKTFYDCPDLACFRNCLRRVGGFFMGLHLIRVSIRLPAILANINSVVLGKRTNRSTLVLCCHCSLLFGMNVLKSGTIGGGLAQLLPVCHGS